MKTGEWARRSGAKALFTQVRGSFILRTSPKRRFLKFGVAEFKKKVESKGPKRGRMYRTAAAFYKGVQTQEHPYL